MSIAGPRISVVIPTYNRQQWVGRAIDSALAQTLPPHDVIVVDDASTDATVDSLRAAYDGRIELIALERNVGGAGARNIGAERASGDFIAFLDSDDQWFPAKLQLQYEAYLRNLPGDGRLLVYGRAELEHCVRGDRFSPQRPIAAGERIEDYIIVHEQDVQTSGYFLSRSLFQSLRFSESLRRHQDIDFVLRAQRLGVRFALVDDATLYKRFSHGIGHSVGVIRDDGVSLAWARAVRPLMSAAAYHHFLLHRVLPVVILRRPLLALRLIGASALQRQPFWRASVQALQSALRRNVAVALDRLRWRKKLTGPR